MKEIRTGDHWWQIYIIKLEARGQRKFYNQESVYYTGITINFGRRFGDYLYQRGKGGFVNKYWRTARKIPVYIEHFFGNEFEAMKREREIKKLRPHEKIELINSDKNKLVGYNLKNVIIRNVHDNADTIFEVK